jgi:predicted kinase
MTPIYHFLIGVPGSGKSTFASQWVEHDPDCVVISTDTIRHELFGDEQIQGSWELIEAEIIARLEKAVVSGKSVIYDATNAKRAWRIDILQKFARVGADNWIGWYLQTPLEKCLQRNRLRLRQVDEKIINSFSEMLNTFEPIEAEGFTKIIALPVVEGEFDFTIIKELIKKVPRAITNRRNRNRNNILHQYSSFIDFERLMHLIAMLIRFPGAGMLHVTNPKFLESLVGDIATITDSLTEISSLMARLYHPIYSNKKALVQDLEWLEKNSIIGDRNLDNDIQVSEFTGTLQSFDSHTYSDLEIFTRLIKTIRCLVHYPCFREDREKTSQEQLWQHLCGHVYIQPATLRKDIEFVLHPYKILPGTTMKRAYYIGTNILTKHELAEVFKALKSHVEGLEDPIALTTYQTFKQKLELSQILCSETLTSRYPVRAIINQPIFDIDSLPDYTVYKKLDELTEAIESGKALELDRFAGTGRFADDPHANQPFRVWPLQIVFHNIGWYLGYECFDGEQKSLLKFERLDRIYISQFIGKMRGAAAQKQALSRLKKLYQVSGSLFLGNDAEIQHKYLNPKQRADVEIVLELWCNDGIFRFISEGTKRFPGAKIKMSKPAGSSQQLSKQSIFSLKQSNDVEFPHRFQVTLPCWAIDDINLLRWIVGFGGNVKVVKPEIMVNKVKLIGDTISKIYQESLIIE